jgi:DNA-binding transcriptional LysR family regulator
MFIMRRITLSYDLAMPRNIDTSLLRAFAAVAETGGMTRAALLLNLTQAAVSQQIKRLEESFGCRLFERDRRGLRLTAAGERLLGRAQRLLALNDEVWGLMTAPDFAGEVRLGIPHDVVRAFVPPILKRFDQAWPRVRVSLVCDTSPRLLTHLDRGEVDLTLTTEAGCPAHAEALFTDPLVWVGAKGGRAWERDPLPLSLGDESCSFRPAVLRAVADTDRSWRAVCEVGSVESIYATLEADLAVGALLGSTVPNGLQILGERDGLPRLRAFSVNLYLPRAGASDVAIELARHIREQLGARYRSAA